MVVQFLECKRGLKIKSILLLIVPRIFSVGATRAYARSMLIALRRWVSFAILLNHMLDLWSPTWVFSITSIIFDPSSICILHLVMSSSISFQMFPAHRLQAAAKRCMCYNFTNGLADCGIATEPVSDIVRLVRQPRATAPCGQFETSPISEVILSAVAPSGSP